MPRETEIIDQVISQMMKGGKHGRVVATDRQKQSFRQRHEKQIRWAIRNLPRCSAAVPAVVVKCLIRYDQQTVAQFCTALQKAFFDGADDPAMLLWKFLQKHRGKDTVAVYQRAVCAAKAYMEGRRIKEIAPLKGDVFNWDEGWTVPDDLLSNWKPDVTPDDVLVSVSQ